VAKEDFTETLKGMEMVLNWPMAICTAVGGA